jgi:CheY-like chemotaxis protein
MSHEMRTPLQSVIGMLDLAMEDEMDAETLRRLETARRSASALMAMIDDVLDFSRIEARKLALEPVYFSLRQFLADTMKSLGVIAAAKQLTLSYVVQAYVEDTVWGDPVRLRQILVNIVGNAVKFTPSGETGLVVSRAGKEIRFSVRDTGVGIPTAARDRIFEPFAQADSSHARSFGGTGLGLSIVVRLLEAMGGRLEVSSEPGSGSVFSFDVPLLTDAVDVAPARQPWESALAGHSIAVVERAEMSRNALQEILRSRGMFVSAYAAAADVPQGRFACAVTCDATVSVQPQVLLISPLDHGPHPIQVTRPVGERELIDAVGRAMGLAQGAEEPRATPAVASKPLRVLLVDDSDVNREVLSEILRRLGHVATVAADGETALEILASRTFDLVFMDVQLPLIDGLEVTRRYRAGGGTTPFIALTAHTSREDREKCLAAGMVSVVTKPVDAVHLASAISTVARRESIADAVGGNAALLTRVRAAFAKQTPEIMNAIRAALSSSDAQALARHAHKLKGSLSYFPGERGSEIAREMEQAAKSGELSRASDMLDDLERAVAELGELLEGVG